MEKNRIEFLNSVRINDVMNDNVRFVVEKQLKNRDEWNECVDVFSTCADRNDGFWRGEFFGKQMRGAAMIYSVTRDEELYDILTAAVERLLGCADEFGRISTYPIESEFTGWDLWGRKYVLVGLEYYYGICRDEDLKKRILTAAKNHVDYIISKIGEGKKSIVETSNWWGCVNSCTILEPVVELYKLTNESRYLDFAKYIISTGGSSACDFVKLDLDEKVYPYQYPVVKAYETMSYHEGLIAYYEATGDEFYFDAAKKFFEKVNVSDITLIGCAGCTNELFDNAAVRQTEETTGVMQETCVTVTWMRVMARLYLLTGDKKYVDRIEKSGVNALYGSLNTKDQTMYYSFEKKVLPPRAFDSYSPLCDGRRGRHVGGYCEFADGDFNGCCIAIGACGIALMPLTSVVKRGDETLVNYFFNGEFSVADKNGKAVTLRLKSVYPECTNCEITVACDGEADLAVKVRYPDWAEKAIVNGKETGACDYIDLSGKYRDGDKIRIEFPAELKLHTLNGKIAFTYGVYTLAGDERKQKIDFHAPLGVKLPLEYKIQKPESGEILRLTVKANDGKDILLTDYQSCGKYWDEENNHISVWFVK